MNAVVPLSPEERFAEELKPPVPASLLFLDIVAGGVLCIFLFTGLSFENTSTTQAVTRVLAMVPFTGLSFEDVSAVQTFMGVLATVPHMARRIAPRSVIALTLAGGLGLLLSGVAPGDISGALLASGLLTFYTLVRQLGRRATWRLGGSVVVLFLTAGWLTGAGVTNPFVLLGAALIGAMTLLANLHLSHMEIEEIRTDSLETLREWAAMAERARIAREMHDIVAHSVSMIAVQAETAPYTLENLDDRTKQEFSEIAASARTTLTEMRRLLGVLRADIPATPETAPQPGLSRLPELLDRHDGKVDLDLVGERMPVPQAVDVSAYRIVQEALTNARVHAPGARVSIELTYRPALLVLRIADDGPGPAGGTSDGHGLVGMRERAMALGGWFKAGPGPAGGFLIQAGLPLE